YYHPANASLVLAGDIEAERAFDLAAKHFGELQSEARPARVAPRASLSQEINLVLEDRVELPRVYLAWHSPAMYAVGDADLDLAADLLANGKTSRLYRSLVDGSRVGGAVAA